MSELTQNNTAEAKKNNRGNNGPMSVASPERRELSEQLIKELRIVLNEVHNKNYSVRFWRIVLRPYLNVSLSGKKVLDKKEIKSKPNLVAISSLTPLTLQKKIETSIIRYVKYIKSLSKSRKIPKIISENDDMLLAFPTIDSYKDLGGDLPTGYPIFTGKRNADARVKANKIALRYSDLYYKNVIQQIPEIYIEYFDSILNSIPLIKPEDKKFHVHILQSEYMEFLVAKYVEHGAKLYWYQHGGCYGEYAFHSSHKAESDLADEFRTWGWKINDNDVPWKAYRLEKFKQNYESVNKTKEYDCLICYTIIFPGNVESMKANTDILLKGLDKSKYKTFLARPRPISKIKSFKRKLDFINDPRVDKDTGLTNMAKVVKESKIVIQLEIPSTNFLECLYVNHPVIGLFTNTEHPSEIVKPYYDFFIKEGVLHTDFESVVRQLNKIDDINEWWGSLMKNPMYQSFKDTFCRKV